MAHDISWRYYGEDFNAYVADPEGYEPGNEYCNICNPFQYDQVDHDGLRRLART